MRSGLMLMIFCLVTLPLADSMQEETGPDPMSYAYSLQEDPAVRQDITIYRTDIYKTDIYKTDIYKEDTYKTGANIDRGPFMIVISKSSPQLRFGPGQEGAYEADISSIDYQDFVTFQIPAGRKESSSLKGIDPTNEAEPDCFTDSDGDLSFDRSDPDMDGDDIPDVIDPDDDNDDIPDTLDPDHPTSQTGDIDGDGIRDGCDNDQDGDGVIDSLDPDDDNDTIPDEDDTDDDNDGIPDERDTEELCKNHEKTSECYQICVSSVEDSVSACSQQKEAISRMIDEQYTPAAGSYQINKGYFSTEIIRSRNRFPITPSDAHTDYPQDDDITFSEGSIQDHGSACEAMTESCTLKGMENFYWGTKERIPFYVQLSDIQCYGAGEPRKGKCYRYTSDGKSCGEGGICKDLSCISCDELAGSASEKGKDLDGDGKIDDIDGDDIPDSSDEDIDGDGIDNELDFDPDGDCAYEEPSEIIASGGLAARENSADYPKSDGGPYSPDETGSTENLGSCDPDIDECKGKVHIERLLRKPFGYTIRVRLDPAREKDCPEELKVTAREDMMPSRKKVQFIDDDDTLGLGYFKDEFSSGENSITFRMVEGSSRSFDYLISHKSWSLEEQSQRITISAPGYEEGTVDIKYERPRCSTVGGEYEDGNKCIGYNFETAAVPSGEISLTPNQNYVLRMNFPFVDRPVRSEKKKLRAAIHPDSIYGSGSEPLMLEEGIDYTFRNEIYRKSALELHYKADPDAIRGMIRNGKTARIIEASFRITYDDLTVFEMPLKFKITDGKDCCIIDPGTGGCDYYDDAEVRSNKRFRIVFMMTNILESDIETAQKYIADIARSLDKTPPFDTPAFQDERAYIMDPNIIKGLVTEEFLPHSCNNIATHSTLLNNKEGRARVIIESHTIDMPYIELFLASIPNTVLSTVFKHEWGHLFGRLPDEYVEQGKIGGFRAPSCPPDAETARKWWGNAIGKGTGSLKIDDPSTKTHAGCIYDSNIMRPSSDSIMNNLFQENRFNPLHEEVFKSIIDGDPISFSPVDLSALPEAETLTYEIESSSANAYSFSGNAASDSLEKQISITRTSGRIPVNIYFTGEYRSAAGILLGTNFPEKYDTIGTITIAPPVSGNKLGLSQHIEFGIVKNYEGPRRAKVSLIILNRGAGRIDITGIQACTDQERTDCINLLDHAGKRSKITISRTQ